MEIGKRKDFSVLLFWGDQDTYFSIDPSYCRWKYYLNSDDKSSAQMFNQQRCHLETKVYENAGHSFFEEYSSR